jgi:hypothetical protein
MTTADMAKVGREIMEGKGICLTCHTLARPARCGSLTSGASVPRQAAASRA